MSRVSHCRDSLVVMHCNTADASRHQPAVSGNEVFQVAAKTFVFPRSDWNSGVGTTRSVPNSDRMIAEKSKQQIFFPGRFLRNVGFPYSLGKIPSTSPIDFVSAHAPAGVPTMGVRLGCVSGYGTERAESDRGQMSSGRERPVIVWMSSGN